MPNLTSSMADVVPAVVPMGVLPPGRSADRGVGMDAAGLRPSVAGREPVAEVELGQDLGHGQGDVDDRVDRDERGQHGDEVVAQDAVGQRLKDRLAQPHRRTRE
jgi:hypothetical protein